MTQVFKLRISRGETTLEVEGDRAFVVEMLNRFESGDAQPKINLKTQRTTGEVNPKINHENGGKSLSSREFVQKLGFKKHTDIVLGFAYYLEHYNDATSFTPADLNACYYDAKMEPSNISQTIIQNFRRGYMMEAKQAKGDKSKKKSYTLTQSGEDFVKSKITTTTTS